MFLLGAAAIALQNPAFFPPSPIQDQVARGEAAYRAGKGIDRVYAEDRQSLGLWFDGRVKRDVEEAIWLSPPLVSRWLGYLQARERWQPGEIGRRWDAVRSAVNGKLALVVRLCSYPKVDFFEPHLSLKESADETRDVRFIVTVGGASLPQAPRYDPYLGWFRLTPRRALGGGATTPKLLEPGVAMVAEVISRDRRDIESFPWVRSLPFGEALASEFVEGADGYRAPLGDFVARWYLVVTPSPPEAALVHDFQLRVLSRRKERVAWYEWRASGRMPSRS
jgi:hypothetical protein